MGFMGFGMQKWIYTMRPRKPFSMQRKGSFTVVPTYKRNFKLQPSKNKGSFNFGVIVLLVFISLCASIIPNWQDYAIERHKQEITFAKLKEESAFNFLIESGRYRLSKGRITGAYSEFKLAKAIKSNDIELNKLLFETLSRLCLDYEMYCDELDNFKL